MTTEEAIRRVLADHHREIEAACKQLVAYTLADDPAALIAEYRRFERAVRDHIEAEQATLTAYAEREPDDARRLVDDHEVLRRLLLQLGVEVELHAIRAEQVAELVEFLHDHAAREERGLYPWIAAHGSPAHQRRLFRRISASLRRLARKGSRPGIAGSGAVEHTGYRR